MIRKLLLALGIVLFGLGIKECADTFSFTASAVPVKSVVVSVEERKGPPKPVAAARLQAVLERIGLTELQERFFVPTTGAQEA